jgi:hypothetical protein
VSPIERLRCLCVWQRSLSAARKSKLMAGNNKTAFLPSTYDPSGIGLAGRFRPRCSRAPMRIE